MPLLKKMACGMGASSYWRDRHILAIQDGRKVPVGVAWSRRPDEMARLTKIYEKSANPTTFRTKGQLEALVGGWDIVEPGLTWVIEWRPDWPDDVEGDSWRRTGTTRRG